MDAGGRSALIAGQPSPGPTLCGAGHEPGAHGETLMTAVYMIVAFIVFLCVLNLVEKGRVD